MPLNPITYQKKKKNTLKRKCDASPFISTSKATYIARDDVRRSYERKKYTKIRRKFLRQMKGRWCNVHARVCSYRFVSHLDVFVQLRSTLGCLCIASFYTRVCSYNFVLNSYNYLMASIYLITISMVIHALSYTQCLCTYIQIVL